jgi:hypothetical protein
MHDSRIMQLFSAAMAEGRPVACRAAGKEKAPHGGRGLGVSDKRRSFFWTRRLETIPAQGVDVGYAHIAASIRARRSVPFIRLGRVCGI